MVFSNPWLAPLFLSGLAAFVSSIGLVTIAMRSDWSRRYAHLFAIMAGGLLLTMVILHLAPEALHENDHAPVFMLVGFFLGLFVHDVLRYVIPLPNAQIIAAGLTPLIAVSVHSFIDGMIYAVTYSHNAEAGLSVALGLILHEFPEAIICFAILRGAGFSNRSSFILAFIGATLTTPFGTLAALPVTTSIDGNVLGILFALSAGLLLFVSTGPLMAHMREDKPHRTLPALGLGVLISLIVLFNQFAEHSHGPNHAFH